MNFRKKGANINNFDAEVLNKADLNYLNCGIPVYTIKGNTMGLIRLDFVFDAGLLYYAKNMTPQDCMVLLREGSEKFSPQEISDILDYNAVYSQPNINRKTAGWGFFIDQNAIKTVLPVIADFLFKPSFPDKELEIYKQNLQQRLKIELQKPRTLALRKYNNLIFGSNHPLGLMIEPEDISKINKTELLEFHQKHYISKNCKIIVSGNTDLNILEILNENLAPYCNDNQKKIELKTHTPEKSSENFVHIQKPDAKQAAIRMGGLIEFDNFEEYHNLKTLNTVLGGYFGSRLMKNIREDKGLTYGIGSFLQFCDGKAFFNIVAEVKGSKWEEALSEIKKEINNLWAIPISTDELDMVKKTILGGLLSNFDGAFASAAVLRGLLEIEKDYQFFEDAIRSIHKIDESLLQNLAKEKLNIENLSAVVAGP
ncbi:MAG: insulinase family protein [Bacteroidales bacterium]|nr:insulinase family protein [Bacteroidales bacterium]